MCQQTTEPQPPTEALLDSPLRLNAALAVAALGTFDWDVRTDAVVLDARSRDIFGLAEGEGTRARELFDRIHPDDFPRVYAEAMASKAAQSRLETEYRLLLPGGSVRIVQSVSEAIRDVVCSPRAEPLNGTGICAPIC